MPLAAGARLGPYEIQSSSKPAFSAHCPVMSAPAPGAINMSPVNSTASSFLIKRPSLLLGLPFDLCFGYRLPRALVAWWRRGRFQQCRHVGRGGTPALRIRRRGQFARVWADCANLQASQDLTDGITRRRVACRPAPSTHPSASSRFPISSRSAGALGTHPRPVRRSRSRT